jgi:hypothetical protein
VSNTNILVGTGTGLCNHASYSHIWTDSHWNQFILVMFNEDNCMPFFIRYLKWLTDCIHVQLKCMQIAAVILTPFLEYCYY